MFKAHLSKSLMWGLLLLSLPSFAQSLTWSKEWKIPTGISGSNIRTRLVSLDSERGILLWGNERTQTIHYALWQGDSITYVFNPNMGQKKAFISTWASTEIAGRDNRVYIVFKADPADTGSIYLLRSEDFGLTFSDPIEIVRPRGFLCRFPGVAIGGDQQPIVSYMRFNEDWSEPAYVSMRSNDFGNSFDPFREVVDSSVGEACDCCPVGMETDGDRIAVLFRNNRNNIRNMTAAVSFDRGENYKLVAELDTSDWFLQSCPSTGGDGFFDESSLHTVWTSGRTGSSRAYYARLDLNTGKINQFYSLIHAQGRNQAQFYPRISGNRDTVGLCWNESLSGMDVFFTWFTGGNVNLAATNTIRINQDITGNQASADIAFKAGTFYLCWQDANDNSIRFKKAKLPAHSAITDAQGRENILIKKTQNGYAIESEELLKSWSLTDITGREIRFGKNDHYILLENNLKGIYIFTTQSGQSLHSYKLEF